MSLIKMLPFGSLFGLIEFKLNFVNASMFFSSEIMRAGLYRLMNDDEIKVYMKTLLENKPSFLEVKERNPYFLKADKFFETI